MELGMEGKYDRGRGHGRGDRRYSRGRKIWNGGGRNMKWWRKEYGILEEGIWNGVGRNMECWRKEYGMVEEGIWNGGGRNMEWGSKEYGMVEEGI
jgi:hypothetical protein